MSTFTRERLAQAQFPSTVGSIYANPSSTVTNVHTIVLYNGNTTTETVSVYYTQNSGGSLGTPATSDILYKMSMIANETVMLEFPGEGMVLSGTNDAIFGLTTTASKVNCIIFGVKVT